MTLRDEINHAIVVRLELQAKRLSIQLREVGAYIDREKKCIWQGYENSDEKQLKELLDHQQHLLRREELKQPKKDSVQALLEQLKTETDDLDAQSDESSLVFSNLSY